MDPVTARSALLLRRFSHSSSSARLSFLRDELESLRPSSPVTGQGVELVERGSRDGEGRAAEVEISHPWPEWNELMERVVKRGYMELGALDGPKNANRVRTACLNFARDRSGIIRYFSRRDIHIMSGAGCPSLDRKVVNSGKRLRAYVGIEEGNVCSSCSLRGDCERAYVKAREDEPGRTLDVMRFLLTYGLDLTTGSVENKSCLGNNVKESVRKLINTMVEFSTAEPDSSTFQGTSGRSLSSNQKELNGPQMPRTQINVPMKQGDWICPKCNFLNFAKNIKCLRCNGFFQERLNKLREDHEHLPLKKGDWICEMCNFLNFAKNTKCLQCDEKPSKRELNPGEWECVSCNYINFRRNMVCLKCDWKRPKASISGDVAAEPRVNTRRYRSENPGISFVRNSSETDEKSLGGGGGANFWCSEGDSSDDNDSDSGAVSSFAEVGDFPVLGGKSAISRDPLRSERWKGEMLRSQRFLRESPDDYEGKMAASRSICSELDDSSDEDDIAGWFKHKNGNDK